MIFTLKAKGWEPKSHTVIFMSLGRYRINMGRLALRVNNYDSGGPTFDLIAQRIVICRLISTANII